MKTRLLALLAVVVILIGAMSFVGSAAAAETLTGNVDSKTITEDTELNLAGYTIGTLTVEPGVKVIVSNVGNIGAVNGGGIVELADGEMNLAGSKLTLKTAGISLRADNLSKNGASVYYTSTFGGNQAVKDQIVAYGTAMYVGSSKNLFADNTYTRNEDLSGWNTGVEKFNDNGVLLKGILKTGNAYSINKSNATKQIYNVPYVELADGTRITGATVNRSLQNVVEQVAASTNPGSDFWDTSMTYAQKKNVVNLYNTFSKFMSSWDMDRVTPYVNNDTYPLYTISDLQLMADKPGNDYAMGANIDLDGKTINGITNFTGSITGNGYAISNGTINGIGLVDTVAAGESITNLHLRDVAVVVPAKSTAQYVGILAANNDGSVTGVTVTGSLKDTRAGSEAAKIYAGVIVGNNAGTVTVGNTVSVSNARDEEGNLKKAIDSSAGFRDVVENDLTTTGLAADAGLWMSETSDYVVRGGLIGSGNAVSSASTVLWSDRSYSTERQATELQRRRQLVVDDVFEQGTIKWTPATTIKYWHNQTENPNMEKPAGWWDTIFSGEWHIHNQTFTKGQTYYGIPYTHCAAPIEQAKYYMTEGANGVYTLKSEVTSIKGGKNNKAGESTWTGGGSIGWGAYFGSDCSGGLTGAWHKVSPIITSNKDNNGVCLYYTTNIVPSQYNQWYYGFKQVGDYKVDDATWSGGTKGATTTAGKVTMSDYVMDCDDIMAKIGATGFYDAYAQSQKGDIVVAYSRTGKVGHARMIAADPVVIRNGNNAIDSAKSYFLFHEQGAGLYTSPGISSWRINWKCSFAEAAMQLSGQEMGGNGVGYYLPITMPAFHKTNVAATGGIATGGNVITGNNPIKYALNSSYRIMSATMVIKDEQGNTVYEATRFQGTSSNQNRRRAVPGAIPLFASDLFADCDDKLVQGNTYYVTFSGTTYGGVTNVKMDNYKIVYDSEA